MCSLMLTSYIYTLTFLPLLPTENVSVVLLAAYELDAGFGLTPYHRVILGLSARISYQYTVKMG